MALTSGYGSGIAATLPADPYRGARAQAYGAVLR
jgi:hypothetical protein